MRRNIYGDPQPANAGQIIAAMNEIDLEAKFAQATIFAGRDNEAPFDGWDAEISDADTGENRISTLGFAKRKDLDDALEAAGIGLIVEA